MAKESPFNTLSTTRTTEQVSKRLSCFPLMTPEEISDVGIPFFLKIRLLYFASMFTLFLYFVSIFTLFQCFFMNRRTLLVGTWERHESSELENLRFRRVIDGIRLLHFFRNRPSKRDPTARGGTKSTRPRRKRIERLVDGLSYTVSSGQDQL